MRARTMLAVAGVISLAVASGSWAAPAPVSVAPGTIERPVAVDRCPTFHWGIATEARSFELTVYALPPEGRLQPETALEEILHLSLPGAARGWTPPLELCFADGLYAWSIRALDDRGAGDWSEARLFRVTAAFGGDEVVRALEVVRAFLEAGGSLGALAGSGAPELTAPPPTAGAIGPPAAGSPLPSLLANPDATGLDAEAEPTTGVVFGVRGTSASSGTGSAGVVARSTAGAGDVAGLHAQTASAAGAAGIFDNTAGGDLIRGQVGGSELFRVEGDGDVVATAFSGDGSALTGVVAEDLDCTGCVSEPALDFDPATQAELDVHTHAGDDIVGGTVDEAEIDAAIARDAEVLGLVLASDGSGSGLDADLLDGNEAAAFMSAAADNWVNESGDTMAGHLGMGGNQITEVSALSRTGATNDLTLSSERDLILNATSGDIQLNASSSTIHLNAPTDVTGRLDVSTGGFRFDPSASANFILEPGQGILMGSAKVWTLGSWNLRDTEENTILNSFTHGLLIRYTANQQSSPGFFIHKSNAKASINTVHPRSTFDVFGNLAVGSYAGVLGTAAPANGLIVSGNVGIGTPGPSEKLEVAGNVKATQFIGDGSLLTDLPAGIDLDCVACVSAPELDFDPATQLELTAHALSADHDGRYYTETELSTSGGGGSVHWQNLSSRPAGLDDGDDDTTYTAGTGLVLTGTQFSLEAANPPPTDNLLTIVDSAAGVSLSSLTIGADGLGLISYYDAVDRDLEVAHCDDTACTSATISTLDTAGDVGNSSSIVLGADGRGLIAYFDNTNDDLKVAHCDDTACTSATLSTIDSAGDVGGSTSITLAADGRGLISYLDLGNLDLKVAHCNDTACTSATVTTLDSAGIVGFHSSIALGSDGLGLIGYVDISNSDLKVAHCSNIACTSATLSTVVSAGTVGDSLSITVGSDGLALISYLDTTAGSTLKAAHCDDLLCSSAGLSTVDGVGMVGRYNSITLGADNLGLISYLDDTNGDLKVAHCRDVACSASFSVAVDTPGFVGFHTAITIGADALPLVSYADFDNGDLKMAHCASPFCVPFFRRR